MRYCHLVLGNSSNMSAVHDESVHLIVTSPPYGSVVAYNRDNPLQIGNYKETDYFKMIEPVYKECKRVLKQGRRLVVNIANVPGVGDNGVDFFRYGDLTVNLILNLGFSLSEIIVWDKGRCRGGTCATGTLPYPASPVLLANWEYIYVFKKDGVVNYGHVTDNERELSKMTIDDLRESLHTVWHFMPETRSDGHPAPYAYELPRRVIMMYSFANEVVLDPFGGSGTTGKAALEMNRSTILYELEEKYISVIKERVNFGQAPLYGDKIWWRYSKQDPSNPENVIKIDDIDVKVDNAPKLQKRYVTKELEKGQKSLWE